MHVTHSENERPTVTIITDYAGRPVKVFESSTEAHDELKRMNDSLSPWEMMAGYFYGLTTAIRANE